LYVINQAFKEQGWEKKTSQYKAYLDYQKHGHRDILVTELNNEFVGYLTINWKSDYIPFQQMGIPEIVDFNVLKKYQGIGIGTLIMNEAEARIKKVSKVAGIGVGLMKDYGAAQILYIKRGYIPDGAGIIKNSKSLSYGDKITIDDDIAIYLTKYLG
jgi:GNAT superfamily N-acetyltransferase